MAEKELRGQPLAERARTIRYYGGELEHLTMAAAECRYRGPQCPQIHG